MHLHVHDAFLYRGQRSLKGSNSQICQAMVKILIQAWVEIHQDEVNLFGMDRVTFKSVHIQWPLCPTYRIKGQRRSKFWNTMSTCWARTCLFSGSWDWISFSLLLTQLLTVKLFDLICCEWSWSLSSFTFHFNMFLSIIFIDHKASILIYIYI